MIERDSRHRTWRLDFVNFGERMDALDCTYEDYRKAAGFGDLGAITRSQPATREFFAINDGAMRLPTIRRSILASPSLDLFVANEFQKFSDPSSRQFGENTFTVTFVEGRHKVGHIERYCGPTLQARASAMRAKAGGAIVALAHTHPVFRGANATALNRDGERFGPGDWVPLVALQCPVYLFTPRRKIHVMEYNGSFVTVRGNGGARKWRVSSR